MTKFLGYHSVWQHVAAPVWLRVPSKMRWRIVSALDKSRHRCWSDLVSDALATSEDDPCDVSVPSLRGRGSARCASECGWSHPEHAGQHACSCYCGKFQFVATESRYTRTVS